MMLVAVRMRGEALWQAIDSGEFEMLETVAAGDTVDFVVYGGYYSGNTPLEANISFTPLGSGAILLRRSSLTIQEAQPALGIEVLRFGPGHLDEDIRVDYATVDGTAHAGEDYVAASGTLQFAAGETNKQITITILDDALPERDEQFRLVLSNPTGGVWLGNSNVVIRIQSDELVTYYVNVNNPNPVFPYTSWATAATNIQDAVDVSKAGDTVLVTNGVYRTGSVGVNGRNRVAVTNAVVLRSVNGPNVTLIEGAPGSTDNPEDSIRCIYVADGALVSGFTLTKGVGWRTSGGGAYCEAFGVLTNCVLAGNSASYPWGDANGGGAYGGILYNCVLTGNSASFDGGNVGGGAANATLYNCTITGNSAYGGGGVYGGTLYNCTLSDNSARDGGGAEVCTLYNCTLTGNSAQATGGGVYGGTLYNCKLTSNSAMGGSGGGVFGGTLYNCTLTANTARVGGGVASPRGPKWRSPAVLYNCLVTGNASGSDGTFYNCTVVGNNGGVSGTAVNSIIYYNSGGNYSEGTTLNYCCTTPLPTNGVGNITGPPLFMDFGAGDYRLWEGSPCIDAGTNLMGFTLMATNAETGEITVVASHAHDPTDMLDNTRFIDGNGDGRVAWDIGAYEFNSFKAPRFVSAPQLTLDGWRLNITGAPNKWVHVQRTSDFTNWENVWSGWMSAEGVQQVNDGDMGQNAMFYRVVVE
jgi:hypothetical protein